MTTETFLQVVIGATGLGAWVYAIMLQRQYTRTVEELSEKLCQIAARAIERDRGDDHQ